MGHFQISSLVCLPGVPLPCIEQTGSGTCAGDLVTLISKMCQISYFLQMALEQVPSTDTYPSDISDCCLSAISIDH